MKRENLIKILCHLTTSCEEFETELSSFVYEFCERKYEGQVKRINGRFMNFEIKDAGQATNEKNKEKLEVSV
jgi:hypothetical protein